MATNEGIGDFSDKFSPKELCEWLAARFKANGLELKEEQRHIFLEEEINGAAFRNLSDEILKNMGFKTGPRMNIMTIIQSLTCTVTALEEKDNKRMTDAEERVEHGDKTESDVPHVLCTMELTPKMDSPSAASTTGPGFAPAALPYGSRLWRKKELKVQIKNKHLLSRWRVGLGKFMECANRWSDGAVSEGSNHIPRFEMAIDNEEPDIVVELNEKGENESVIGHVDGEGPTQMYLYLGYDQDKNYQEHLIVHEFGHALGLGHEHQRSDFWNWIEDYIDENKMKKDPDMRGRFSDWQCKDSLMDGGATPYDSGSVMHYWFKKSWLTKDYNNKEYLDKKSKFLSEGLKRALYGIHERDGDVVTEPSRVDLDFLSAEYKKVQPGKQSAKLESIKKEETGRSDSRTVPDSDETDHVNGAIADGPSPQTGNVRLISGRGSGPAPKRRRMDSEGDITAPAPKQAATGGDGATLMASPASGSQKDKMAERITDMRQLQKLENGEGKTINIIRKAAHRWKDVAGLIAEGTHVIKNLEDKHRGNNEDAFKQLLTDYFIEHEPSFGYTQDWYGLVKLLSDAYLGTLASDVEKAIKSQSIK